jgi:hypothetical protein
MADTIRARIAAAPKFLDDRLVPVDDLIASLMSDGPRPARRRVAFAELENELRRALKWRERLRGAKSIILAAAQDEIPRLRPVPADRFGSPPSRSEACAPPDPRTPP